MAITMHSVEGSSNIAAYGYDQDDNVLALQFWRGKGDDRQPGPAYYYANVPAGEYDQMLQSGSLGKYFAEHIKGQYETRKGE